LDDEARAMRVALSEKFSALDLWPRVGIEWSLHGAPPQGPAAGVFLAPGVEACSRAGALSRRAPHLLNAKTWSNLENACSQEVDRGALARPQRWFKDVVPAGTALLDEARVRLGLEAKIDVVALYPRLHDLAPFDGFLLYSLLAGREDLPVEQALQLYGPLVDYDLTAMRYLAGRHRNEPAIFRQWYERIAAIEPSFYLELGDYLVDLDLQDDAAVAYQKAVDQSRERVGVSNNVRWLVGYLCDRGRTDRAREVAEMAAEVYSSIGLKTMGYYLERMGRYPEAETWYLKIVERYAERAALEEFYVRYAQRVGDGRFGDKATAALRTIFPSGLERVTMAELTSPPTPDHTVVITGRFQSSTRFGLQKDDLVVAVNGYRVRNSQQYQLIWSFDDKPDATVIVWRAGRYVEIKGPRPRIKYGPVARQT
jgi:tetratricopeptide (TPR) repeat protein